MMLVMKDTFDKLFWWKTPIPKIVGAQKPSTLFNHCLTQYSKDLCLDFVLFKHPPITQKQLSERNCNITLACKNTLVCSASNPATICTILHTHVGSWTCGSSKLDIQIQTLSPAMSYVEHGMERNQYISSGGGGCSLINNACSQQSFVQVRDLKPLVLRI
jgi:hypothetical protein